MLCRVLNKLPSVLFAVFLFAATIASAQVTTVPGDLNPGDSYRLIFVTSGTGNAMSGNIADLNGTVASFAEAVPELDALSIGWSIVGSTGNVDARVNIGAFAPGSVPVYRLDGTRVVDDAFDLWGTGTTSLSVTVSIDEEGNTATPALPVWTGSNANGTASANPIGATNVTYGLHTTGTTDWLARGTSANHAGYRYYGISSTLTVAAPSVPVLAPLVSIVLAMGVAGVGVRALRG